MASEPMTRREHYRVGAGKCVCGFDAYKINGIMVDYHEELMYHLRHPPKPAAIEALRPDAEAFTAALDDLESLLLDEWGTMSEGVRIRSKAAARRALILAAFGEGGTDDQTG